MNRRGGDVTVVHLTARWKVTLPASLLMARLARVGEEFYSEA